MTWRVTGKTVCSPITSGRLAALTVILLSMELSFDSADYNLYAVPVLLNGEPYNLQVAYDFTTQEWSIRVHGRALIDHGMVR